MPSTTSSLQVKIPQDRGGGGGSRAVSKEKDGKLAAVRTGKVTEDGCPLIFSSLECPMDACLVVEDEGGSCTSDVLGGLFRCMTGSGVRVEGRREI